MTIKLRKSERDTYFAFFLSTTIWFTPLRTFAIEVGDILHSGIGRPISKIMILCFLIYTFIPFYNYVRVKKWDAIIFIFILIQWFRSLVFHVDYAGNYISILLDFLIKCVPFYFIAGNTINWKLVKEYFYKAGTISIFLMFGLTLIKERFGGGIFNDADKYSMFYGLLIGRSVIVKCIEFFDTKKFRVLLLFILSIGLMILYGTRTPIVCVAFLLFLFFIKKVANYIKDGKIIIRYNSWKLVFAFIILLVIGSAFIIVTRARTMDTMDPGERILYTISNGKFFKSEGRLNIFNAAKQVILEHPLLGTGLIGDRIGIVKALGVSVDDFTGYYAHNLFVEFILQTGIIVGAGLTILVLLFCFNGLFRTFNDDKYLIYMYLISFGVGSLMLSGTAIRVAEFWIFLSMGIRDLLERYGNNMRKNYLRNVKTDIDQFETKRTEFYSIRKD